MRWSVPENRAQARIGDARVRPERKRGGSGEILAICDSFTTACFN